MPTTIPINPLDTQITFIFAKGVILLILIFYAIFALMVTRQVDLMGKTLITPISPILKAFSIIHAGFAIGLIVLTWGIV